MANAIFKASDGTEFATSQEADKYSEWLDKKEAMENAVDEALVAFAGTKHLADGSLLNVRGHQDSYLGNDYYYVDDFYVYQMPQLRQINIWVHQIEIDGDRGRVEIRRYDEQLKRHDTVPINKLHTTKKAADVAYVQACQEWINEKQAWLDKYRESLISPAK